MAWFQKMCRNVGLMIHNIGHPDTERKVLKKEVEEHEIDENVTLRRTTIEEMEIRRGKDKAKTMADEAEGGETGQVNEPESSDPTEKKTTD